MTDTDCPEIIVVGSGPAGISATQALLKQGLAVTLVDAGGQAPQSALDMRNELASTAPAEWDRDAVERYNHTSLRERDGIPLKTVFGSDFPYHFDPRVADDGAVILGSRARGGLSNAWGASILPLSKRDMANWPLTPQQLEPHYKAVMQWLPHAVSADDLAAEYPLHSDRSGEQQWAPELSQQGRALATDLEAARKRLHGAGVRFGRARLALRDCRYCGQCLHGCPYDFIYNSNSTLAQLLEHPGFSYLSDTVISGITEEADAVVLRTEAGDSLRSKRVFLATGVLPTALLLMPLLRVPELRIRDSAYTLLPFLRNARSRGIAEQPLYTLPQFFMEVDVPQVSNRNAHLQWYGYNDFYKQELLKKLGVLRHLVPEALQLQVIERMWSVQTFLHSDDSPDLLLRAAGDDRYVLSAESTAQSQMVMRALTDQLRQMAPALGGRFIAALARPGIPGGSFHSGGTLPMSQNPGDLQSDLAGRPHGLQRVHIVDSSVFPDIASSTITLSVMANAHRIASDYRLYA